MINYDLLIKNNNWIVSKNQSCILSPDFDGLLCGLFMSYYFNWEIVGFYDGKNMITNQNKDYSDCVFLDMEILVKNIKSIGHHMLIYNKKKYPEYITNLNNCINPNLIRNFDVKDDFKYKYPFAMIHLLMCIAGYDGINIELPKSAATHLLYADGTFKNMLNYPENCNNWANYLQLKVVNGKLYKMFLNVSTKRINILIHELEDIFNKFAELKIRKIRGDKVSIEVLKTNSDDYYANIDKTIEYLSQSLNWSYNKNNWKVLNNRQHKYYTFKKEISPGLNLKIYNEIISKKPLSMAVTARSRVEYTICT